ncbi:MAG: chorismate-binding protein [Flavobacteriaceae bacterium]|tara:strand:- start:1440 stop:2561 length:1122 start_codon:yes stop_codon:yes gene_type:complete
MISDDFFEQINMQFQNKLPFVAYRKPNQEQLIARLQHDTNVHFVKDFLEKGFVFSPFDDIEKTIIIPNQISKVIYGNQPYCDPIAVDKSKFDDALLEKSKAQHIHLIKEGVKAIKNSELKKVVLSRCEVLALNEKNPIEIFRNLTKHYKSALIYCWYHPKVGLWLGATPETLLKIENNRFSIMALAGTQDFKGDLDVEWQPKEKQEQQYVTDFIIDNLKPSVNQIDASDVKTVRAGNLLHLRTIISAQLKPNTALKHIIEVLHPTPAVCGLPKEIAKDFILKNEHYNREFYTGFLGELNGETTVAPRSGKRNIENRAYAVTKNSTQLYVNLRCMQIKDNQAIIYVGGGITESSDAENEWQETISKSLVIKSIL